MNREQHRNGMQNNTRGEPERFRDPEGNYSRYPNQGHRPGPGGNPYPGFGGSQNQYYGQQYPPQGYNAVLSKPPDTGQAAPPQYPVKRIITPKDYIRKRFELEEYRKKMEMVEKDLEKSIREAEFLIGSKTSYKYSRLCKRGLVIEKMLPETKELSTRGIYCLFEKLAVRL